MSNHDAFLQAICESPDDDVPRLVYADWLEENGFQLLAEFIRVQIELARAGVDGSSTDELVMRQSQLWNQRRSWGRLPPNWIHAWFDWYRRGLLEEWSAVASDFLKYADELWSYGPIRKLELRGADKDLVQVANCPQLSHIKNLKIIPNMSLNRGGIALARSPHFAGLKSLTVDIGNRRLNSEARGLLELAFGNRLVFLYD